MLIFNIISIIFFPGISTNIKNNEKLKDDPNSLIQISSSGPPNKDDFKYYKVITFDHNKISGTGSHQNFPVLISIFDSDLHDDVQSSGNDIAFAYDNIWLDHEIEAFNQAYNSTHAQLIVWVRIPNLSTSKDTIIHLYYGNTTMLSQENPNGVWDKNFKGVWHLSESSGAVQDSTSYNTTGTISGSVTQGVTGQIYNSYKFDGIDSNIDFGDPIDEHLDFGMVSFTIGMWLKINSSTGTWQVPLTKGHPSGMDNDGYRFEAQTSGENLYFQIGDGSSYQSSYIESITFGTWINFVGRVDRTSNRIYLFKNGAYSGYRDISAIGNINSSNPLTFSRLNNELDGFLDEVQICNISRSDGWIATEFENQNDPNSFYSIGNEKSVSGHPINAHYFAFYKEIIIAHSMVRGPDVLLNFPVLISSFDEDLHDDVQSNGNDIAFSDGVSWLDHEIESFNQTYNDTHAQLISWVCIPRLSSSVDTIIRMYYGNSTMSSRENPLAVWDSNYKGVWHLSENPTGTIYDSTSNNHDGIAQGSMISSDQIDGQIDGSLDFEGNDEYIDFGNPAKLQITGAITVEAWFNADYFGNTYLISKNGPSGQRGWDLSFDPINSTHGYAIYRYALNGYSHADDVGNITVVINQWYHIVGVYNPSTYSRLFLNGQLVDENVTDILSSQYDAPNNLRFGARGDFPPPNYFDGTIDEVRISNIARSSGWIETEYNNQYNPINFYSIGKEYTVSGIPPNENFFKNYKEITISHSMVSGLHDFLNFLVLISILDTDLHDDVKQSNGNDIAFAHKGAWLDHEIELFDQTYNDTHAQLISWVCIPRLSTSMDTVIRMYYGNATILDQENPTAVWSSNYRGVWHLSETSGNSKDSTYYGTEGVPTTGVTQGVNGLIGYAYDFDGISGTRLDYGDPVDDHLDVGTSSFTISVWVKFDQNTGTFQMPLYKGGTSSGNEGYALEINNGLSSAFYVSNGTQDSAVGWASITLDSWIFLVGVVNRTSGKMSIYKDGSFINDANVVSNSLSSDENLKVSNNFYPVDGIIDEPRICDVPRSSDWIATEYNNQYSPLSFLTLGPEESFDIIPPSYSNLLESSDPLELGNTEIITINVSDPSGINQVKIEFAVSNHSMTNIGGNTWQYDSWTPSSVGSYPYTIWMEDNCNNWNSTMGIIEVRDTTPPTYSDLIESADPLQLGQNETITIKVYDSPGSGVNQVLLEYDSSNHSMSFVSSNTWSWSKWKPTLGPHSYTIWIEDIENNLNYTSGTITVVETDAPIIENLNKYEDPLELGNDITINVDVFDEDTNVSIVLIELDDVNYTMEHIGGNTYEYNWTRSWVGTVLFIVYANDSSNNWNSYSSSFDIVDTTPPVIENLSKSEDPLELGNTIIISVNSTDLSDIKLAKIEYLSSNYTMTNITGEIWEYNAWKPDATGNWSFTIWVEDNNNNWANINDSILVRDTILPIFSDLTESVNPVELGDFLTISINSTDIAGIKEVSIEFEDSNHTMTNIGDDIWQYNSWVPNSIGNYTYTIFIIDNNDNRNYVESWILFQDTKIPVYSNFIESTDPLELGDNPIIEIDIYDFAGINQVFLEFEGANHSMTNINGDTWQYDSWKPDNWIVYQYRIHMEDMSGNWNSFITNITVQDTIPPSTPLFANSPIGDVSGLIVFDWLEGSDPSGISYYILIIDNETNPLATPGFVYIFNITNIGSESSYCVLPQNISLGTYFYFLAQVDGVGQQSNYAMGAFTVISVENGTPGNNTLLIIVIILVSVISSVTAIIIVRTKLKKDIIPSREKIPLKMISSHINKLSSVELTLQADKIQEITNEKEVEIHINEIISLGEELFAEGAYLEAQEQFKVGRDFLLNLGREEDAKLFSELISGIEGLIEERERRLEVLEKVKNEGDSVQVFEIFCEIIAISKNLRDPDTASYHQSELIQFFQTNKSKLTDLEKYIGFLEQKADSLLNNNQFEDAAQIYGKCEDISQLFIQLERDGGVGNFEKYKRKKDECLNRVKEKKF